MELDLKVIGLDDIVQELLSCFIVVSILKGGEHDKGLTKYPDKVL